MRLCLIVTCAIVLCSVASGSASSSQRHWAINDLGIVSVAGLNDRGEIIGVTRSGTAALWQARRLRRLRGVGGIVAAINATGTVIGERELSGPLPFPSRATRWMNGKGGDLPSAGVEATSALALNAEGDVVGWAGDAAFTRSRAALWRNGSRTDLGSLPGLRYSYAQAINDRDQIVGASHSDLGNDPRLVKWRACLWENGGPVSLGVLPGQRDSSAVAINASGQIVGVSGPRMFLWQNGRIRDLGTLGGEETHVTLLPGKYVRPAPMRGQSPQIADPAPQPINQRGQIIGASTVKNGSWHGFVWQDGRMQDIAPFAGDIASEASAINNQGQVVGNSYTMIGPTGEPTRVRPFIWQSGTKTPLPTLGGAVSVVVAINNHGQVIGLSQKPHSRATHAVRWTLR